MPSWCKDLKNNIIGIEMSASPPAWDSSTPLPKDQLAKLASLGFVDGFRDYEIDHDYETDHDYEMDHDYESDL